MKLYESEENWKNACKKFLPRALSDMNRQQIVNQWLGEFGEEKVASAFYHLAELGIENKLGTLGNSNQQGHLYAWSRPDKFADLLSEENIQLEDMPFMEEGQVRVYYDAVFHAVEEKMQKTWDGMTFTQFHEVDTYRADTVAIGSDTVAIDLDTLNVEGVEYQEELDESNPWVWKNSDGTEAKINGDVSKENFRGKDIYVHPTAMVGGKETVLYKGARVEAGARVNNVIVRKDGVISEGTMAVHGVVGERASTPVASILNHFHIFPKVQLIKIFEKNFEGIVFGRSERTMWVEKKDASVFKNVGKFPETVGEWIKWVQRFKEKPFGKLLASSKRNKKSLQKPQPQGEQVKTDTKPLRPDR